MKSRIGRTAGAAMGAVIFVLFCATIAERLSNTVSAAERTDYSVTVTAP